MSILQLPRELFLEVCEHLSSTDLAALAGTTKDLYIAVQEPLYTNIEVIRLSDLRSLATTLARKPGQTRVNATRRQAWQAVRDSQLQICKVKKVKVVLDYYGELQSVECDIDTDFGPELSTYVGAIRRSSPNVNVHLEFHGPCYELLEELGDVEVPGITKLTLFLGNREWLTEDYFLPSAIEESDSRSLLWNICFSGSTFPDLQDFELDTIHESLDDIDKSLHDCAWRTANWQCQANLPVYYDDDSHEWPAVGLRSWQGLQIMTSLKLQYTDLVDEYALASLFRPSTVTHSLQRLEITNCPMLTHSGELEAISAMLRVCLKTVERLKLHMPHAYWGERNLLHERHREKILNQPSHHLCDIVHEMAKDLKFLDLALPYACSRMFSSSPKAELPTSGQDQPMLKVPREPPETLPRRLDAAGYKYRRLICWDASCSGNEGEWEAIEDMASHQGEKVSWEIVSKYNGKGSWHMDGCSPTTFKSEDVLIRELPIDEW